MDITSFTLEIAVGDLESATQWYGRLLGRSPDEPVEGVIEFELSPTAFLMLSQREEGAAAEPGSVNLEVPDLQVALAEIEEWGIAHSEVEHYPGQLSVFSIQDPDGRDISVVQIEA